MQTLHTRKFERITGIPADWDSRAGRMTALIVESTIRVPWFSRTGRREQDAYVSLLDANLKRIRDIRMGKTKGRCEDCDKGGPLHLHHLEHRSASRDDREANLRLICVACHKRHHGIGSQSSALASSSFGRK